jgi:hypothetical protein
MTAHDPIAVSYSTLEALRTQLLDLGVALSNTQAPLGECYDKILDGSGQFADQLTSGATEFLLSWKTTLDTMSDGATVVGNSIGKSAIDFAAADAAHGVEIIL